MHLWSAVLFLAWLFYNLGLMGFEFWVGLICFSPWWSLILQLASSNGSPRDRGPMREQVCIAYWVLDSKVEQCNSCHILQDWNCHKSCQDTREGKKDTAVWKQEVQGHIVKRGHEKDWRNGTVFVLSLPWCWSLTLNDTLKSPKMLYPLAYPPLFQNSYYIKNAYVGWQRDFETRISTGWWFIWLSIFILRDHC